ncbi:Hypothetical protein Y17_4495 [Pectobacterium wasabiae CFBP 3304]|uniref:hypothetical protein n=1 Tax=Pectobacterium wasabiae TaxID=55208 RepID=UPI00027AFF40|nr:hypothetical protein [Pectobacterium wasabiae]EJS92212.1 Hypothetical protein Y17_4711 [Pectobacterium wasabiae CFBP 3304]EJS92280.1 Hypothetical protein Y17_4495 [Pectobacterium wasabiae CFBP 3304]
MPTTDVVFRATVAVQSNGLGMYYLARENSARRALFIIILILALSPPDASPAPKYRSDRLSPAPLNLTAE